MSLDNIKEFLQKMQADQDLKNESAICFNRR